MAMRLHIMAASNACDLFMLMQLSSFHSHPFTCNRHFFTVASQLIMDLPHRLINIISTQRPNRMRDVNAIKIALIAKY